MMMDINVEIDRTVRLSGYVPPWFRAHTVGKILDAHIKAMVDVFLMESGDAQESMRIVHFDLHKQHNTAELERACITGRIN